MSVPFPQIDYPRGSLPRGGSDIWDTPQASVVLADDMFASAEPAKYTMPSDSGSFQLTGSAAGSVQGIRLLMAEAGAFLRVKARWLLLI